MFFYKKNYDDKLYHKVQLHEVSNYDVSLTKDYGESFKDDWKLFKDDHFLLW